MKYYKANTTWYKGIRFRSRLESMWAAFFDNVGWRWDYEPVDMEGWVPDFMLEDKVLIEVKPLLQFDYSVDVIQWQCGYPVLLLGLKPFQYMGSTAIGWDFRGDPIMLKDGDKYDIHSFSDGWKGWFTNSTTNFIHIDYTKEIWNDGLNKTQYKKPKDV